MLIAPVVRRLQHGLAAAPSIPVLTYGPCMRAAEYLLSRPRFSALAPVLIRRSAGCVADLSLPASLDHSAPEFRLHRMAGGDRPPSDEAPQDFVADRAARSDLIVVLRQVAWLIPPFRHNS